MREGWMFNLTDWLTWSPCSLISSFIFLRRYKADEVKNTSLRLQVSFNYQLISLITIPKKERIKKEQQQKNQKQQ